MKIENLKGLYIAHRGIQNSNTIENTIPAFSLALDKKVPIELDLHILKDGNIVVYHDDNLQRLMGIDKKISSYDYEELRKLTFPNTNIHISLLQDVLNLVNGKVLLIIEIKKTDIYSYQEYCKKIVSILEKYPYPFAIKSFDIRIVRWFLKNTNYLTGLLIANPKRKKRMSIYDILMNCYPIIYWLNPDFISVDYHIATHKFVKKYRKKHPVLLWTIRDINTLNQVKAWGDSYLIEKCYFD